MSDNPDEIPGHMLAALEHLEAHTGEQLLHGTFPPSVLSGFFVFLLPGGYSIRIDHTVSSKDQLKQMLGILDDSSKEMRKQLAELE